MNFKFRLLTFFLVTLAVLSMSGAFNAEKIDYFLNVVVVGDKNVGKTTLIENLCLCGKILTSDKNFKQINYFYVKKNKNFIINIFEINESLEELEKLPVNSKIDILLQNSNIVVVTLDFSEMGTIDKNRMQRYKNIVKTKSPQNITIFLTNKIDLMNNIVDQRYMFYEIFHSVDKYVYEFWEENKSYVYFSLHLSAKNNFNVKHLLDDIICYYSPITIKKSMPICIKSTSKSYVPSKLSISKCASDYEMSDDEISEKNKNTLTEEKQKSQQVSLNVWKVKKKYKVHHNKTSEKHKKGFQKIAKKNKILGILKPKALLEFSDDDFPVIIQKEDD